MTDSAPFSPRLPHVSVMRDEVVTALAPQAEGVYVDGTFGAGGYTRALLEAAPCRVWAIDRDPAAVARGAVLADRYEGRLHVLQGRFGEMDRLLADHGVSEVDGIALDLGVSSMQLDEAERGFSFRADGPLDMRMESAGPSAADAVNTLAEGALADVLFRLGEERASRRIARAIVASREAAPITRTGQLAQIVRRALGNAGARRRDADTIDPATRTFQALRLYVNRELEELTAGLAAAERLLGAGGRLAVVAFHSLEDRIVKTFLRERADGAPRGSRHVPDVAGHRAPSFALDRSSAARPGEAEVAGNPRARSARLRTARRTTAPAWEAGAWEADAGEVGA